MRIFTIALCALIPIAAAAAVGSRDRLTQLPVVFCHSEARGKFVATTACPAGVVQMTEREFNQRPERKRATRPHATVIMYLDGKKNNVEIHWPSAPTPALRATFVNALEAFTRLARARWGVDQPAHRAVKERAAA